LSSHTRTNNNKTNDDEKKEKMGNFQTQKVVVY